MPCHSNANQIQLSYKLISSFAALIARAKQSCQRHPIARTYRALRDHYLKEIAGKTKSNSYIWIDWEMFMIPLSVISTTPYRWDTADDYSIQSSPILGNRIWRDPIHCINSLKSPVDFVFWLKARWLCKSKSPPFILLHKDNLTSSLPMIIWSECSYHDGCRKAIIDC